MPRSDSQFQSGGTKPPGSGRQKGTPNKPRKVSPSAAPNQHTALVSAAITECVQLMLPQMLTVLHTLSLSRSPDDQVRFLNIMARMIPYAAPRGGGLAPLNAHEINALDPDDGEGVLPDDLDAVVQTDGAPDDASPQTYDYLPDHMRMMAMIRDATLPEMGFSMKAPRTAEDIRFDEMIAAYEARNAAAKATAAAPPPINTANTDPFAQPDEDDDKD